MDELIYCGNIAWFEDCVNDIFMMKYDYKIPGEKIESCYYKGNNNGDYFIFENHIGKDIHREYCPI